MSKVGTHTTLRRCLVRYAKRRANETAEQIVWGEGDEFYRLAKLMDKSGWRRYTKGMISREVFDIQAEYDRVGEGSMTT